MQFYLDFRLEIRKSYAVSKPSNVQNISYFGFFLSEGVHYEMLAV
jgi:hypothetical protein